jgi:hypothetical protein
MNLQGIIGIALTVVQCFDLAVDFEILELSFLKIANDPFSENQEKVMQNLDAPLTQNPEMFSLLLCFFE